MIEVVLDTETTGLSIAKGHRIVEIGCVELKNQIPTSNQNYQSQDSLDLNNLDFLMNIGEKYIQSAELNLVDNIARIDIKNMPESQYMILKNVSSNFNVIIASDNTQALNGLVNGDILLNLEK